MFGLIPPSDPEASDEVRRFPAHLALDVIAARRLMEVREELGLTQSEVARAATKLGLKWTRNTVHAIERFGFGGRPLVRRPKEGPGESPPPERPHANPQSGTRRLSLMELFAVPRVLELACETRGLPIPRVHPLWFLPPETFAQVEEAAKAARFAGAIGDPGAGPAH